MRTSTVLPEGESLVLGSTSMSRGSCSSRRPVSGEEHGEVTGDRPVPLGERPVSLGERPASLGERPAELEEQAGSPSPGSGDPHTEPSVP